AADPLAHRVRRQPDGVDAESAPDSGGPPARRPVHGRPRPVRDGYGALRRLRAPGHEPDRAPRSGTGLGAPVSRAESPSHSTARRVGVEYRAVSRAGTRARSDGVVSVRVRRVDVARGHGEPTSVARRDHLRTVVGTRIRALEPAGGLATVCKRGLSDAER